MSANPFTLSFGKKPLQYISRLTETNQILESFCAEIPSNQIYMITGVRGSGKTVMMTNIASELRKREDWIVVELNPTRDLLQSLALVQVDSKRVPHSAQKNSLGFLLSQSALAPTLGSKSCINPLSGCFAKCSATGSASRFSKSLHP